MSPKRWQILLENRKERQVLLGTKHPDFVLVGRIIGVEEDCLIMKEDTGYTTFIDLDNLAFVRIGDN